MKNLQILLIAFLSLLLSGCSDFLEVESKEQVSDATLWANTENAELFLNNVYASLPGPFGTFDPEENWSDNSLNGVNGEYAQTVYAISAYTPNDSRHRWSHYDAIRKANLFIERVNASDLPANWKQTRLAEARLLRAYFYTLLWTSHGGVPLITTVLSRNEQGDEIFYARNTAQETFEFIREECEAIAGDLPLTAEAGRATRGAALTLKGWVELFWASPLYNVGGETARWAAAATTNKRVMDLGVYDLFSDYNTLHFEDNNKNVEVIFDKQYLGGTTLGGSREGLHGPAYVNGNLAGYGGVNPTQELVDEYSMANGLPINDPNSGYDPQNPYEGREKRFYQSIIFDGSEWAGDVIVTKQGLGSRNATDITNATEATNTGYYLRKGLNPAYTQPGGNQLNSANFIIFRYGEVLLSYAEAQNEAAGPDASVYMAINRVRVRSELPPLPQGMTQEEMRTAIHRERRVELAFEEKRWHDLLRLRLAEKNLNGTSHAMVIRRTGDKWVYNVEPSATGLRIFDPQKNYFLPIPQSAIDRNPKLEQNPNY